jgi:hypothetical protein
MDYSLGDTVTYRTIVGRLRSVVVTGRDVEEGSPVFDGYLSGMENVPANQVWGYDDQIVSVMKGAAA